MIGFANWCSNSRITDYCELVRICELVWARSRSRPPSQAQRCAGELLFRRSEQPAANWGENLRIQMVSELVRIANYQHSKSGVRSATMPRNLPLGCGGFRWSTLRAGEPRKAAHIRVVEREGFASSGSFHRFRTVRATASGLRMGPHGDSNTL